MKLKMSAAQWVRDGDALSAAGPVEAVELTTRFDALVYNPSAPYLTVDPVLDAGLRAGLLPVCVSGWGWSAETGRWVRYGFKCLVTLPPDGDVLSAVWPGVRFTAAPDPPPRRLFTDPPDDPAAQTVPPGPGRPVEPGAAHPWRAGGPSPVVVAG